MKMPEIYYQINIMIHEFMLYRRQLDPRKFLSEFSNNFETITR